MFNTEIIESCSARPHSTKVVGMVFRKLNNTLIFLVFSPIAQIFPAHLKNVSLSQSHFEFSMWLISALSFCDSVKTHAATQQQCFL